MFRNWKIGLKLRGLRPPPPNSPLKWMATGGQEAVWKDSKAQNAMNKAICSAVCRPQMVNQNIGPSRESRAIDPVRNNHAPHRLHRNASESTPWQLAVSKPLLARSRTKDRTQMHKASSDRILVLRLLQLWVLGLSGLGFSV